MTSPLEQGLSRSLRSVLADLPIGANNPESEQFRDVLTDLQYFIPRVLGEIHREWDFEGLDDVLPVVARKTGEAEAEIFGICCIIGDQTLTPLHLHLQVALSDDEISWLECRLGERKEHGGADALPSSALAAQSYLCLGRQNGHDRLGLQSDVRP